VNPLRGFTLIETLVAISILLLSLAGPLTLAAQSLSSAYYARDQITASYLAQEAVEYARAVRDQNYLAGDPWLESIDECMSPAICTVDFPNFSHSVCSGACPPIRYNEATGLYNMQDGSASIYRRELTIESIGADEVSLSVRVFWNSGTLQRSFEIRENILNWL
jgi:prepilin-type N-terminal cleavage/methylation domain-containing protein